MKFVLRQAWREIKNSRSFCFFYSLNLALGLVGFVLVDAFRESIESKMANESKELLGADLAMRARRSITYEELDRARSTLPTETREATAVDFFSMAAGPTGRSRLVKVVAIDRGFPSTDLSGSNSVENCVGMRSTCCMSENMHGSIRKHVPNWELTSGRNLPLGKQNSEYLT